MIIQMIQRPKLFQIFRGTIRKDDPEIKPMFQKASAINAMDMVEELFTSVRAVFNLY